MQWCLWTLLRIYSFHQVKVLRKRLGCIFLFWVFDSSPDWSHTVQTFSCFYLKLDRKCFHAVKLVFWKEYVVLLFISGLSSSEHPVGAYKVLIGSETEEEGATEGMWTHESWIWRKSSSEQRQKLFSVRLLYLHLRRASCIFSCTCSIFSAHSSLRPSSSSPMTAA